MTQKSSFLTPRLILGVAIVTFGVLLTLDNLDILDADHYWDYAPLILVVWGLAKLVEAPRTKAWISSFLLILVGSLWTLYELELVDLHPIDLWPVLLIIGGFALVRRALAPTKERRRRRGSAAEFAILSGVERQISSKDFKGGDYTAIMGGCEIDLREAEIAAGEAVIDVFALMGGIEIRVPRTFTVEPRVTAILGGFSDQTDSSQADPDQRLVIRGLAMMGGVDVKN